MEDTEHGEARIGILDPKSGTPVMVTSQKLFQDILEKSSCDGCIQAVTFQIAEYRLSPFQPLVFVTVTDLSDQRSFLQKKRSNLGLQVHDLLLG